MGKYAVHRIDANAEDIYLALQTCGFSIYRGGPLDCLAARAGETWVLEVKTKTGKLRPSQAAFLRTWPGKAGVVRSVNEALRLVGVLQ